MNCVYVHFSDDRELFRIDQTHENVFSHFSLLFNRDLNSSQMY